jgi:hypothetical protein
MVDKMQQWSQSKSQLRKGAEEFHGLRDELSQIVGY